MSSRVKQRRRKVKALRRYEFRRLQRKHLKQLGIEFTPPHHADKPEVTEGYIYAPYALLSKHSYSLEREGHAFGPYVSHTEKHP